MVFMALVAVSQPVTITPPEAHIAPGESVTLTASGAMYYSWAPATGLSVTDEPVTVASPMETTTYTCSGYGPGAESVVNGDFSQGNEGFTSAYQYNTNLWGEGTYYVDNDASLHHENFFGTGHGDGGNFMIVNGSTTPQTNVWTEEITVVPHTRYAFSTWVCTLAGEANEVALLQFSINGNQIGEVFSAPTERYVWEQFYELWDSGDATSATITILNQNTVGSGNDFGLDDISFCELVLLGAPECTVYVGSMSATATADESEFCIGESTTLHALPTGGSGNYTYSWSPANSLDNPNAQHPVATPPAGITTYTCIVDDGLNTQEVSVTIEVHPNEMKSVEATICENDVYYFMGDELTEPGEYPYHLTTQYGCDSLVVLTLSVDEYQTAPTVYQYECYEYGSQPAWYWDKTGVTYHEDTYDEILLDDPQGGCPILHRLDLKFHEEYYHVQNKVACNSFYWPINGETYTSNQDVEVSFQNEFGDKMCDSTYVLHLEINTFETNELDYEGCNYYVWDNDTISDSGSYERTYTNQQGCDSIVTMNISLHYAPRPSAIMPLDPENMAPHWVVTASEFQINSYDFTIDDLNPESEWDSVVWSCDDAPLWMLEPYGEHNKNCKVSVLNHLDDTVWLTARVFNGCSEEGVCQRYWLVCSFYGIEDAPSTLGAFTVNPNPNSGLMTLNFEHLTGKIDLKVFDMRGMQIDHVITYNTLVSNNMQYDMTGRPNGVYLFVATGNEGVAVQKVILQR